MFWLYHINCRLNVLIDGSWSIRDLESKVFWNGPFWWPSRRWLMGYSFWLGFGWPINGNPKNKKDDSGYGAFFIGGPTLSTICTSNKDIGYILGVEFAWGKLLMEVMGGIDTNAIGIHYGKVWAAIQVEDDVLDILEGWCLWVIIMAWDTVGSIHDIRSGVLYNMDNFPIFALNFPR